MGLRDWLKPGLQIKRWIVLILVSTFLMGIWVAPYLVKTTTFVHAWTLPFLGVGGLLLFIYSLRKGSLALLRLFYFPTMPTGKLDHSKVNRKIYDQRILARGPKIVVIGGGTGLSILLRGLKQFTSNITAIVTVADDGGGSGKLREDLGMLPPGDIRSCIIALADMEPTMERLLQYRFQEGSLKGQSFGNLLIASMNGISNNFEEAIKKINEVLAVTGKVLPVTLEDITLYAKLENAMVVKGESNIPFKSLEEKSPIERVFLKPRSPEALPEALEAILQADIVVLGPGSLYTSVIPNLLVKNIVETMGDTQALKVYIPNMMTQPGETDGYGVMEHIKAILDHCNHLELDYVISNNGYISEGIEEKYRAEGSALIRVREEDRKRLRRLKIKLIEGDFVEIKKDYVRHDAVKLSRIIVELALQQKLASDRNRIVDYFYIKEWLKKRRAGSVQ